MHTTSSPSNGSRLFKDFLLFSLVICFLLQLSFVKSDSSLASIQWTSAVDAAMGELTRDPDFQNSISIGVSFIVPSCTDIPAYPARNPIPSNITEITICHEPQTPTNLWGILYKIIGKALIVKLNKRYGLTLTPKFLIVDTSKGYFPSLKYGADSGLCDVVVSDTAISPERAAAVKFATCPFGNTYFAFLRTDLDNTTITNINTVENLNRTDIKISWWFGTLFDRVADSIPQAQKIPSFTMEGMYTLAQNQSVHAILFNALDLISWKNDHPQYCAGCYVKMFGDPIPVAIFTSRSTRNNGAFDLNSSLWGGNVKLIMLLFLIMTIFIL